MEFVSNYSSDILLLRYMDHESKFLLQFNNVYLCEFDINSVK